MKIHMIDLLSKLNSLFLGQLISVDIEGYIEKISEKAVIITIYSCGILQGFIAYYNNDEKKETAYLTMIAIDPDNQGMGYGISLIDLSIKNLKKEGFKKYQLEVLKDNLKAINIYEEFGFTKKEDNGNTVIMEKYL
jgi:ribosomal-protein-alanine N-acetyltransferase